MARSCEFYQAYQEKKRELVTWRNELCRAEGDGGINQAKLTQQTWEKMELIIVVFRKWDLLS